MAARSTHEHDEPCVGQARILGTLLQAAFVTSLLMLAAPSFAQSWPAKPVRIIVPSGVGSVGDVGPASLTPINDDYTIENSKCAGLKHVTIQLR